MRKNYKLISALSLFMLILSAPVFAQIPNYDFENWHNNSFPSYTDPDNWGTLNSQTAIISVFTVEKATGTGNVHSGSAAIKLSSHYISFASQTAPGIAVTGTINTNTQALEGGFPYTSRPVKLIGWYKYAPVGVDTADVEVYLFKRNGNQQITVADGVFNTSATVGSYTQFSITLNYHTSDIPDTARIFLSASSPQAPQDGTAFWVDSLAFVDCSGFSASVATTPATTVGGTDGTATLSTSGGTASYTYAWNTGASTQNLSTLPAGSYCVTVTDGNACTASACGSVTEPSCAGFSANVSTTDATTPGGTDGTATANVTGGATPYTYLWSPGSVTTSSISNLPAGSYCVVVTDNVNCSASACGIVSSPSCAGFAVTLAHSDATTHGGSDGTDTATVVNGTSPYTYTWSNGANTNTITALPAGTYCITVLDNAGCAASACDTVGEPSCAGFSVAVTATGATTVGGSDGSATATVTGGSGGNTYLWNNSSTQSSISNLSAGAYCVTVTNSVNCTVAGCDSVGQPSCAGYSVAATTTNETVLGANDGTANATVTGGNGSSTYSWSNSAATQSLSSLAPGNYCVTATDAAGCTATACNTVAQGPSGISEETFSSLKIYPNPAQDVLTIQTNASTPCVLTIFAADGKLLNETKLTTAVTTIDIKKLNSGSYIYKIKSTNSSATHYGRFQVIK